MRDQKTLAIVLKRIDYGEADRILQVLTPEGKRSVIARGVKKEKSNLAGGIELFSVSEVVIHQGKGDLGILTSTRLVEYYDALVKDIDSIELGGRMMREVCQRAEQIDSPEFFDILRQALRSMQKGINHSYVTERWKDVLQTWWWLNLARAAGEDVNLNFDTDGQKLAVDSQYYWDEENSALAKNAHGKVGAENIKLLRLMVKMPIETILKVKNLDELIDECLYIAKCTERETAGL